jgi:hypothetical protein
MGLVDGLKKAIDAAGEQLTRSSPKPLGISFTTNFQQKAKAWGLSEKDALDVFYHGEEIKPGMKARTYNGYELYIYYGRNSLTGTPYISTIGSGKSAKASRFSREVSLLLCLTGCATRYPKQVGDRVPCGFTRDLHDSTCFPAT